MSHQAPLPWRVRPGPSPQGPYKELSSIAAAFGVPHLGAPKLVVFLNGTQVCFELEINSGTVHGLTVSVFYEGAATQTNETLLTLTREGQVEREGKRQGIARESQTGDAGFDEAVYIDTTVADSEVRRLLDGPAREAVRDLLATSCGAVHLATNKVWVSWVRPHVRYEGEWVLCLVPALLALASRGPAKADKRNAFRRRGSEWVVISGIIAVLMALVLWLSLEEYFCGVVLPLVGAVGAGLVGWRYLPHLTKSLVEGDSGSFVRYRRLFFLLLANAALVGALGAVQLNALVDWGTPQEETGTVVKVSWNSDEGFEQPTNCHTTLKWAPSGEEERFELKCVPIGTVMLRTRHRGLLGVEWVTPVR